MEETKKYKIGFMGTPEEAAIILQALINSGLFDIRVVITRPDKPVGRSDQPQPSPVKQAALSANILVLTPEKVKGNSELLDQLRALDLDTIVVAIYSKILPPKILDMPKMGVVNVHPSILPKYRGASPVTGAILNNDPETGVTIMRLEETMDTGPIIGVSEKIKIESYDTTSSLAEKLAKIGAEALIKFLPDYLDGKIIPVPQADSGVTYVKLIDKQDGLINWQEDAAAIERKIRAYYPWPGTFTKFNGKTLKIIRADVLPETGTLQSVWRTPDGYPAIFANGGSLKLIQVQLEGKKPTTGADFLKGYPTLLSGLV